MSGVTRRFGGVTALCEVSVDFRNAEVHALVGENGSGKSTLVKVLSGALAPDEGSVTVDGEPIRLSTPRDAIRAGIATLYQEMALVPELTVEENVLLGHEPGRLGVLGTRGSAGARDWLEQAGVERFARHRTGALSTGIQQMVAIAKALSLDARLFIFDEPTAALSSPEVDRLFALIRLLRERGFGVLYITHRLAEVRELADMITVLKDGRLVTTVPAKDMTEDAIVEAMVGRKVTTLFPDRATPSSTRVLEARGLRSADGFVRVDEFWCRAGEIVGIAGLDGSGRSRLAHMLVGAEPLAEGTVEAFGERIRNGSVVGALERSVAFTPADRPRQGVVPTFTLQESITQSSLARFSRLGYLRVSQERDAAERLISMMGVRAASLRAPITSLSGGNQQKAVLARALCAEARVLVCDEPTAGVDVGARADIYVELSRVASAGLGLVLSSSDMTELLGLCHRIVVMCEGAVAAELDGEQATEEELMRAQLPQ